MAVTYKQLYFKSRDNEMVSKQWFVLLYRIHRRGRVFNVNEGHRTKARQAELVREKGLWSPSNPTGAAAVSDDAPHILTGRPYHAIDCDNAIGVVEEAQELGVKMVRPLAQEPWHIEVNAADLARFYRRNRVRVFRQIRVNKIKDKIRPLAKELKRLRDRLHRARKK